MILQSPPLPLSLLLILLLSPLSTSRTPSSSSSSSPQPQSFDKILLSHGLPIGLFPNQITNFTLHPITNQFTLSLSKSCNAKFENQVHYDFNVTGTISYGEIGELSGVSAQDLFLWFPVRNIRVDVPSSGVIYFDVGGVVFKQFSLSLFETAPDCLDAGSVERDGDVVLVDLLGKLASKIQSEKLQNESNEEDALRAVS